eukprot:scaffold47711_cov55-Phaeocystis_antarctica.AAC.2
MSCRSPGHSYLCSSCPRVSQCLQRYRYLGAVRSRPFLCVGCLPSSSNLAGSAHWARPATRRSPPGGDAVRGCSSLVVVSSRRRRRS